MGQGGDIAVAVLPFYRPEQAKPVFNGLGREEVAQVHQNFPRIRCIDSSRHVEPLGDAVGGKGDVMRLHRAHVPVAYGQERSLHLKFQLVPLTENAIRVIDQLQMPVGSEQDLVGDQVKRLHVRLLR